jgi:hypothetical protein
VPLDSRQEQELTGGGDTMLHYHNQDRGPFPIPHGSFYDTTNHTIASTTAAYALTYDTTVLSKGVRIVSSSRITVDATAIYNIQFSAQLENSDSSDHDTEIWFAKNGTNITESSTIMSVPSKHGAINGHCVAAWNLFVEMNRNDYVEIYWKADSTSVFMPHRAAATSPTRPSVPSIILTVNLVSV